MSEKMEKALSLLTTKYQKTLKALDDKPKKRGMTLEEYIEEAVHFFKESKEK